MDRREPVHILNIMKQGDEEAHGKHPLDIYICWLTDWIGGLDHDISSPRMTVISLPGTVQRTSSPVLCLVAKRENRPKSDTIVNKTLLAYLIVALDAFFTATYD